MARRGTQHLLAESEGVQSNADDLRAAFKLLKDYITLYGTISVSSDSDHPINIRKGKLIGSGGFANVYSGINTQTGELVAIKEIQISDMSNRSELLAIEKEFALLRQLRHPNVVRYIMFEQSVSQKMCRIVMEFMAGGSAQGLTQKFGPLTESIVRQFATDMLNGIAFIHREGIIHRDIKPANILVSATGQLKLADFGCSKRITESNLGNSCIIGTPVYMAPEFIRGQCTPKADIWATGCTLFELFSGHQPWYHTGVKDNLPLMFYITTTSESPLVLPRDDTRQLSDEFIDFLDKCFTRDPEKRPSAEELLQHTWITSSSGADATQREIEEVTVSQSVELCETLSTQALIETREIESCRSTPRASEVREPPEASVSPSLAASTHNSPQHLFPTFEASTSGYPAGLQQAQPSAGGQYLLLNQEKGELEFAACPSDPQADQEIPCIVEPESEPSPSTHLGRSMRKSFGSSVSFLIPEVSESPSSSPSSALVPGTSLPAMTLDGPVHMSFSFKAGGSRVSVGLQIQPEDVTCRIIDRRPSFVVAMNDHIKGQLTNAMSQFSQRKNDDVAAVE